MLGTRQAFLNSFLKECLAVVKQFSVHFKRTPSNRQEILNSFQENTLQSPRDSQIILLSNA
jgi:hypothetical protein